MFVKGDALSFPHTLVCLFVEQSCYDNRLRIHELFLCEAFRILRIEREIQNFIPSGHCAFIDICGLQNWIFLVILHFYFNVGLNLRRIVELLFRFNSTILAIIFNAVLSVVIWVTSKIGRHVGCGSVNATLFLSTAAKVLVFECFILFDQVFADGHILSFDDMHNDFALWERL